MPDTAVPLIAPSLANIYQALMPVAEAMLRVIVGLLLVPHGLRMTFGAFPNTGLPIRNLAMLSAQLDRTGWRPGRLWAPAISLTQLVCGPLLALGMFTRLAAIPVFIFLLVSNVERWRVGGWFWNKLGLEYTLLWTAGAFYFLVRGGGAYSLDRLVLGFEF
jgi:putative oxidoreductase